MAHGEIYVQLSVNFADDPKVRALARYGRDARRARDLYVQMICYCKENLTDGLVPAEQIGVLAYPDPPKVGEKDAERLAEVGLIQRRGASWYVAAFLKRNRSRQAVRDRSEEKKRSGAKANHVRWHVERGVTKPDCEWCQNGSDSDPKPDDGGTHDNDATNVSDHLVNGHGSITGASPTLPVTETRSQEIGNRTESSQRRAVEGHPKSDPLRTPTGIHIGHRSEDIGHRSIPSDPSDPPPPSPHPTGSAPDPTAGAQAEGEEGQSQINDLDLIRQVRELRPDWTTASITRALNRSEVLERPAALRAAAMLAVARDPASQHPGRLAHDGPWWTIRLAAERPPRPAWCGECDERTRQVEVDGVIHRCPLCHPLRNEEAS
ncbi:hypothetical protein GCM10023196_035940 [Actinoallomurus vinaceus]|uniref:Uncharacterized protein n=1 Tax=Actinoallomurus vinaceus TaxID=1080074 RepID=A0ABP8UAF7_9ACTN